MEIKRKECPGGEINRSLNTKRCLKPCSPGSIRNPTSMRCKKASKSKREIKDSPPKPPVIKRKSPVILPLLKRNCLERSKLKTRDYQARVIRDLLYTNKHGIVAVHGLGSGKTHTAVTASQCFLDKHPKRKIVVISPKSLIDNMKDGMVKYGNDIVSDKRYSFYSFESFANKSKSDSCKICKGNMIIIDEAHKLRTAIVFDLSGKVAKGKKSEAVIRCSKCAEKVLLLTGTPFVNNGMDLNNLVAIANGTDPLTKREYENMWTNSASRKTFFSGIFDIYMRETDKGYPRTNINVIKTSMSKSVEKQYTDLEQNVKSRLAKLGLGTSSQRFLTSLRQGLLKIKNSDKLNFVVEEICRSRSQVLTKKDGTTIRRKSVIFTNFVEKGVEVIKKKIKKACSTLRVEAITGKTKAEDRQMMVNMYNKGRIDVLLLSPAANQGLNLMETADMYIIDPPWNKANLDQATGRSIRLFSHKNLVSADRVVNVHILLSTRKDEGDSTSDEILFELISKKENSTKSIMKVLKGERITRDEDNELFKGMFSGREPGTSSSKPRTSKPKKKAPTAPKKKAPVSPKKKAPAAPKKKAPAAPKKKAPAVPKKKATGKPNKSNPNSYKVTEMRELLLVKYKLGGYSRAPKSELIEALTTEGFFK
jgi:SNF2 family DNA or RNA helicase